MIDEDRGRISIDFSGDSGEFVDFNKVDLKKHIENFVKRYCDESEILDVSVYLKKFEASYFGKPLIFCSFAVNTTYGLVSSSVVDWGLKKAINTCLKSMNLEINKLAEREIYGEYAEVGI